MWPIYFNANVLTGESEDSSSSVAGVVAGCVVGVVVCIAIIALAIFLLWYQKRKKKNANNQGNYIWQCMQSVKHIITSYFVCTCSNIDD